MAAYHDNAISDAEKALNPGQKMRLTFISIEKAHNEYVNLKRALKRRLLGGRISTALRSLDIKRVSNEIWLSMEMPEMDFPTPVLVDESGNETVMQRVSSVAAVEESCTELDKNTADQNMALRRIIAAMREDLENGDMTREEFNVTCKELGIETQ